MATQPPADPNAPPGDPIPTPVDDPIPMPEDPPTFIPNDPVETPETIPPPPD
jgi:hypothetical protein